jgi:hypothetical protein
MEKTNGERMMSSVSYLIPKKDRPVHIPGTEEVALSHAAMTR